jgi:hypothetical protein
LGRAILLRVGGRRISDENIVANRPTEDTIGLRDELDPAAH